MKVTILMPCLNEAETLASCIQKARQGLENCGVKGEVLIADNGSTDGSQAIAIREGARVVNIQEKGYGNALRGGIKAAQGEWVIMGDADDSYNFLEITPFIEKLQEGYELVMGCRMPRGGGTIKEKAMPWKHRWLGNPVLTLIGRTFFKAPVHDFHCGLRAFNRQAILKLELQTTGMEFASEMVIRACLAKIKITEVPITLYPDGRSRPPHLRSWRDGWRHLRFMLLYSPAWLFFFPGLILFLLGLTSVIILMSSSPTILGVNLDINTLVYSCGGVITGTQLVVTAIMARVYAANANLLPQNDFITRLQAAMNLEKWLGLGTSLFIVGISLAIYSIFIWHGVGFGNLRPTESIRIVAPATTCIVLGIQIVSFGFILDLLRHQIRVVK